MSLRVWLPLNGTLDNKGLDDVVVTNNGATVDNNGKIGKCYSFDGNDDYISLTGECLYDIIKGGTNSFSISFWIYQADSTRAIIFGDYSLAGGIGFNIELTAGHVVRLYWNRSPDLNISQLNIGTATWSHVALVYDTTHLYGYLNGNLVYTYTGTLTVKNKTSGSYYLGRDSRTGSTALNGKLNDFRLYDHVLSPLEVKEISKGLVLHYPLSDAYVEATTNLITTEDCLSSTCYNAANGKYSYGTATDMYKIVTTYEGRKGTKVYMGTNGNNCFPYVYINNMYTSDGTNSPAYKTLSFDYYTTISTSISPYKLGNGDGTATYIVSNSSGIETGTGVNSVVIPVVPNTWNHIEITFHGTTAVDSQWGYITNRPTHVSNTDNFWFFANMQLETKDHATGYAGVGGIRNSNMIYDCSGFCNNGTIFGALTISNDTPKYKVSTYMPTIATITHNRCLDNSNQEWSCAAWVKPTVAGNYQNLNNFNVANRLYHGTYPLLYANTGTNDYYNYGNLALPANQWSHIVFVFKNSDGTKLVYINGENHTNTGGPNKTSIPEGIPDTVIIGGSYEGGLCDYREYATALSAEDIKSLYNNSAYIDNQGNIYGAVYEEV